MSLPFFADTARIDHLSPWRQSMRILVYLAALAIFLFIVNLGAQWLGANDEDSAVRGSAEGPAEPSLTQPQPQQPVADASADAAPSEAEEPIDTALDLTVIEALQPADTAVPPSTEADPVPTTSAERAEPSAGQESGGRELPVQAQQTLVGGNEASHAQAASVAETEPKAQAEAPAIALERTEAAASATPAATQSAVAAAPTEPNTSPENAIERFASNAANVAEDAVESVSNTLKSVSDAIGGDAADGLDQPLVPDSIAALMRRHAGSELLVLFWHPKDETVVESFAWLDQMQTRYGSQGIKTVAVNLASDLDRSGKQQLAHSSNIEQRSDPERILARAFWVQQVPSVYLLAADGALLRRIEGFDQAQVGSYEDSVRLAVRR